MGWSWSFPSDSDVSDRRSQILKHTVVNSIYYFVNIRKKLAQLQKDDRYGNIFKYLNSAVVKDWDEQ